MGGATAPARAGSWRRRGEPEGVWHGDTKQVRA